MRGNISSTLNQMKITNVLDMEQDIYPKCTTTIYCTIKANISLNNTNRSNRKR